GGRGGARLRYGEESIGYFRAACALRPDSQILPFGLAWSLIEVARLQNPEAALTCLEEAMERLPNHRYPWVVRASIYAKLSQWDKAVADSSQAIKLDPKVLDGWNKRGSIYGELGQ